MSIVVETAHPQFEEMRDGLLPFAELVKSPEYLHTYRLTPVSVWNAASVGMNAASVLGFLTENARYGVPQNFEAEVSHWFARCEVFRLVAEENPDDLDDSLDRSEQWLRLDATRPEVLVELMHDPELARLFVHVDEVRGCAWCDRARRGLVKERLVRLGYPVTDLAGYVDGAPLAIALRELTSEGKEFGLRPYQREAVASFHHEGRADGGSGVVVLPCGGGKTVVGLAAMAAVGAHTLVLTPNTVALRQWKRELLDKTDLREDQVRLA
jgi:DNA excision repair protein ERCC-3